MTVFKKGALVHVEFDGVVLDNEWDHVKGLWTQKVRGRGAIHWIYLDDGIATLADPENWPPQLGDIWSVDGDEYFARQNTAYTDEVVLESFSRNDSMRYYSNEFDDFKARGPALVRRK